jgi:hypothetical protein
MSTNGQLCARVHTDENGGMLFKPSPSAASSMALKLAGLSLIGIGGLVSPPRAAAQTCVVTVLVTDPAEAPVPNARVTVVPENGVEAIAEGKVDASGEFVAGVPAGLYSVKVETPGFAQWTRKNVEVSCGEERRTPLKAQLKIDVSAYGGVVVMVEETHPIKEALKKPRTFFGRLFRPS